MSNQDNKGRFTKGNTLGSNPRAGSKNICSLTKRADLAEKFAKSELTDPLDFLLHVVHNPDEDGVAGKGTAETKDRIDCAKAAVPYIYAKPTLEIDVTTDAPVVSIADINNKMMSILGMAEDAINEQEEETNE